MFLALEMLAMYVLLLSCYVAAALAAVTVYGPQGVLSPDTSGSGTATPSMSVDPSTYTNAPAFNSVILQPPPIPNPPPPTQFPVSLASNAQNVQGLSIKHGGDFLGFSIEMSVGTEIMGLNGSFINVPFLNLMSLLSERGGRVRIRFGGNTQDYATVVPSLPDGKDIEKDKADTQNPTQTPSLIITPELIYMLSNISSLVNVQWYLGIPLNDTTNLRLQIAEVAESILGDNLLGLQVGNEPDLYASHQHRPPTYSPQDYFNDVGIVVDAMANDPNTPVRNNLIVPSVSGTWTPEEVWDTGIITTYTDQLTALAVERYPDNNCAVAFPNSGFGDPIDPQTIFPSYLTHASGQSIVQPYLNSTSIAQQAGKPFLMLETNTASCGGFPGVSDSFGAALWMVDYALQMAFGGFTAALLHVGGVSDTYNPFNPPFTNMSTFEQWTITPIFYSTLVVSEALSTSGTAQVVDLGLNGGNDNTPGYGIYENGTLARLVLINYMTDPSGQNTYTASISVGDTAAGESNATPAQVTVKYLLAPSVSEKYNVTWGGQTFGGLFESDGTLRGNETTTTVTCDQTANTCAIPVPAPAVAVVFLTPAALEESVPLTTETFATTTVTRTVNTATVPPSVLATSNGENGTGRQKLGSTSKGSSDASRTAGLAPGTVSLVALVAGAGLMLQALWA